MKFFKQQRALGFARASLIIGICNLPTSLWFYTRDIFNMDGKFEILFLGILLAALAGLILGVIGLIGSIRKETRSKKGMVLASIGIVLNMVLTLVSTIIGLYLHHILTYTMDPM